MYFHLSWFPFIITTAYFRVITMAYTPTDYVLGVLTMPLNSLKQKQLVNFALQILMLCFLIIFCSWKIEAG